jgi:hypothetical protein
MVACLRRDVRAKVSAMAICISKDTKNRNASANNYLHHSKDACLSIMVIPQNSIQYLSV